MAPGKQLLEDGTRKVDANPLRDNYVGEKRNHLRDGYGVYKFENQFFKYEGQWRAGKQHEHGKLLMKDGTFYEGEFKDGEITGHGFKYFARTRNTFSGQFYMGEIEGDGVMRYSDGSTYEGQWRNNQREGKGKLTEADGSYYEGEFYKNRRHGDGKNVSSDGTEYEGGYINGLRHGHGVLKMVDGSVFDGQWINDVFNGEGTMIHSSGFTYEGLWVNGKPAQRSTKMQLVGVDPAVGITISQGENFTLELEMVDDDGEVIPDNGRELKVTAGYKYLPKPSSKDSNLFDAIEDVEESLIQTPMGYTVLPYPITDQLTIPLHPEDTDLTTVTHSEPEESATDNVGAQATEDGDEQIPASPPAEGDDGQTHPAPQSQKAVEGRCRFPLLTLLPPPPLYRPFQQLSEKSSSDLKSKQTSKKPAVTKSVSSDSKANMHKNVGKVELETICRTGSYVLMVSDVTDPPFLGESLPTLYTMVTVKRKKREHTIVKEKGPKWDTNKHIAASIALHREDTLKLDAAAMADA